MVAVLAVGFLAGWTLFLLVSEQAGMTVLAGVGIGLVPFLGSDPITDDGAGGPDPLGTLGRGNADLSSGPFLGGDKEPAAPPQAVRVVSTPSRSAATTSGTGS